ncbi:MAG: hypothetical protein C0412_14990, partial [Flavobacterium sp.]|nr:hypothetical protein [Flavobacterium sp.]
IISLKVIPENILNEEIDFTPIDYCSRAIVELMKTKEAYGNIFHILNWNKLKIGKLIGYFESILQIKFDVISNCSFEKYVDYISENIKDKNSEISTILNEFNYEKIFGEKYRVEICTDITKEYLTQMGFEWCNIDENYLRKAINHWINVGYLVSYQDLIVLC